MDGLPDLSPLARGLTLSPAVGAVQRTLKSAICCVGTGLHSGQRVNVVLKPAPVHGGIVFRRTDLGIDIPARFDLVSDTRLCTVLALPGRPEARVGTVEHIMAALFAAGIDNVVVELNGPEVPILDGSAEPFLFLIECAGRQAQSLSRRVIGLEPDNDKAEVRGIVIHAASYVDPSFIGQYGRIGRSQGCFAVSEAEIASVLGQLTPGRLLYAAR